MSSTSKEWMSNFEKVKHLLTPLYDLESAFKNRKINDAELDVLEIGSVNISSGDIIAIDPLSCNDDDYLPFFRKVPTGKHKVSILIDKEESDYALVRVSFSENKPTQYEIALTGEEDFSDIEENDFFGFNVDAGMACVCDKEAFKEYIKFRESFDNIYDEYFDELLTKNAIENPKYQKEYGDWLNWTIPNTEHNIVMFTSGYGDGCYPAYFGIDENNNICALYIMFIDLTNSEEE